VVSNSHTFAVSVPGGHRWTVTILGNAGIEFGVVLYENRDDLISVLESDNPRETFLQLTGAVISMTFERERDLPPPMVKEVRRAGWEVAAPRAWPYLYTYNSIAGGLTSRNVEDLIAIIAPLSGFVAAHSRIMLGYEPTAIPLTWSDHASGVQVQFDGVVGAELEDADGLSEQLAPGGASGPGAVSLMVFEDASSWENLERTAGVVVDGFGQYLKSGGGGSSAARAAKKHAGIIDLFVVHFLAGVQHTPLPAVNEYDLRVFLYDWFPRKASMSEREFISALASLRYFFDFIGTAKGIECSWAAPILRDKETFLYRLQSKPAGMFWDEAVQDWQAQLYADLDDRVFLHDQGDAGGIEWGYMQGPVESMLAQLLERLWLKWRDEVIAQGERDPAKVRAALIRRQHEFERTAPAGKSDTPATLVAAERKALKPPGRPKPSKKKGRKGGGRAK
jgi:hypothetical protein